MAEKTNGETAVEEPAFPEVEEPITLRVIASSFVGGLAGLVAMAPVLAGVPIVLGVFEMDALAEFSRLVVGEASPTLGVAFFAAGGVVVLPLFFVVTASYLPPQQPRFARGITISSIFWVSFVFVFWPAAGAVANAVFVLVSLVSHWIYGAVLGIVLSRLTGIPEHEV